jgi:hypothetical protein
MMSPLASKFRLKAPYPWANNIVALRQRFFASMDNSALRKFFEINETVVLIE